MSEATVRCPKCGHEGIVITELLNSDLALIADSLQAENEKLQAIIDEHLHRRKCWECGNVAWHKDNVAPYVLCRKCCSADTRPEMRLQGA